MTQKADCTKMASAHPRPHFSVDERVFKVLKYTETGNVLQTIRRFQRQFPNRNVHYCRSCLNLNHTEHTYCNCSLLFVCMVSTDSETAFETFWLFPEHYRFLYSLNFEINHKHLFIFRKMWSGMYTTHLCTVLLLSAPFVCFTSWFHLS